MTEEAWKERMLEQMRWQTEHNHKVAQALTQIAESLERITDMIEAADERIR